MGSGTRSRSRRAAVLGVAAYCGVVVWLCLAPFDFHPVTAQRLARAEWIPLSHPCPVHGPWCLRDPARNVALYVPFGMLVALARRTRPLGGAALVGGMLALAVEAAQLAIPTRAPSTTDLAANVLGSLAGAEAIVLGGRLRQRPKSAGSAQQRPRPRRPRAHP